MENVLIIAEKKSVAESLAKALGASRREDGYFSGSGYLITYCVGHLFNLCDTKEYNPAMTEWRLEDYPFIPEPFKYTPNNNPKMKSAVMKQIKVIKELVPKADLVIEATDADREGQLISSEVIQNLKIRKPRKRLWITSHTPKDIIKGMNSLRDHMVNLEAAGYCRQQLDWLMGINFTVVFTLKATGGDITLKLGRVVLPTLYLIFKREVEISNFTSRAFFSLKAIFRSGNDAYTGTYFDKNGTVRFPSGDILVQIKNEIQDQTGAITRKETKQIQEYPPRLFNLTDLQGHISSKYNGISADDVMDIMESLYIKKHLTYPRTSSRYLDESLIDGARESLQNVINLPDLNIKDAHSVQFHTDKRVFDSSRVDSHPAIIPTYIVPDMNQLTEVEQVVYLEVVRRFVSQFMPAAVYDQVEIITQVGQHSFVTRGKVLVSEGWRQLYNSDHEDGDREEDPEGDPDQEDHFKSMDLNQGDAALVVGSEIREGKTEPPAHYTEKTLLKAMENCGKHVENEELILQGFTIGTPSTRADTISKLIKTGYVSKKGKSLLITELGAKVVYFFPIKRLLEVEFTGRIEKTLKDIENGQYDSKTFMEKMVSFVRNSVQELIQSEIPAIKKYQNVLGVCPEEGCGRNVVETERAYSCEGTKSKICGFTIWKDDRFLAALGKKMTEDIARELVNHKQALIKNIKSKKEDGGKYNAYLIISKNSETGKWGYTMKFCNDSGKGAGQKYKKKKKTIKFKMKS